LKLQVLRPTIRFGALYFAHCALVTETPPVFSIGFFMMKRLWLVFAQVCTVCVAALFTVSALRPEWLTRAPTASAPTTQPTLPTPANDAKKASASDAALLSTLNTSGKTSLSDAAKRALPAVVKISTSAERRFRNPFADDPVLERFFGRNRQGERGDAQPLIGQGSGVIVRADGYILTNNHVIEGAEKIQVELYDKRVFSAKKIGTDPESDLAVIRVEATDLPTVAIEDSSKLAVGDLVLAIGNPFGVFGNSVTMGIVSALGRTQIADGNPFESFIQTDAAINQGNSGGALVNIAGDLVGINTSIFTRTGDFSGIGFAIPTELAKPVLEQLIANGEVRRGYIGATLGTITPDLQNRLALKEAKGAFVAAVIDGGPGARAGVRPNDVIVEVNGKAISDRAEAINAIASSAPEQTISLKLLRGNDTKDVNVTLGKRPLPPKQRQ
jgi:serine protease DegQ